jgi:spore germination protein YaaH
MLYKFRKIISFMLIVVFMSLSIPVIAVESQLVKFSDVKEGHWAEKAINELRRLKITDGIGNNKFGMGKIITRSEFVTYLVKLMKWQLVKPAKGSFIDNMDANQWYYSYIETALDKGVFVKSGERFRPTDPITREEMAIMIVNTLGVGTLAKQITYLGSPFEDVSINTGYITIARGFGIISGVGGNKFKPQDTAKREEAAAMMMRMYEKLNKPISELHAFYAISSYNQMDMISSLDSVSFGWSRLEYDQINKQVILNTTNKNSNDYYVPKGFSEPVQLAQQNNVSTQLMVYADNTTLVYPGGDSGIPVLEYILSNAEFRKNAIASIVQQLNSTTNEGTSISFDGVVIDFESMKGNVLKQAFNVFLGELRKELDMSNKKMYVAVHPERKPGQEYYDGYDFKTIGELADKVILMAHDYYAKKLTDVDMQSGYTITPLSPIDEVYYALKAITDTETGVQDVKKVLLQISFDAVQWKLKDGKVINQTPYQPNYEAIERRLLTDVTMNYSNLSKNPNITFYNSSDQTNNVIWYEDSRSVQDKIKLAKMFGVNGISLWRLGNIPDYEEGTKEIFLDIWKQIQFE